MSLRSAAVAAAGMLALAAAPAFAQEQLGPPLPCGLGMVQRDTPRLLPAAVPANGVAAGTVKITFVGHATFLLETAEGVSLATDYNGHNRPRTTPEIVTMNNFHITHYTNYPDPGIRHVLRGWDDEGGIARHHMKVKDLRVYSVPTNIQQFGTRVTNGNSIFVFDTAGICIAHLSHLHHDLTAEDVAKMGRVDVLIVPVDGFVTMSHAEVMSVIGLVKPRLVLPCHWDLFGGPAAFARRVHDVYPAKSTDSNVIELSRDTLPRETEILFLRQGP